MPMTKIIITGTTGYLGRSFYTLLSKKDVLVKGLNRVDLSSIKSIKDQIHDFNPQVVIHAAGSASVKLSIEDPWQDFVDSVLLLEKLLEGIRLSKHRPLVVFFSSAAVYGQPESLPIKETAKPNPLSPYGCHKVICEFLLKQYATQYSIPAIVIRPFSTFGPLQKRLLVWEIYSQLKTNSRVILSGSGQEKRDYLYSENLVNLVYEMINKVDEKLPRFTIVNLASGRSISVIALVDKIKKLLNCSTQTVFLNQKRAYDPDHWEADVSRCENMLSRKLKFDLESDLEKCLKLWDKEK